MSPPRRLYPSIAALRALEALDRLGSASAAARELDQTQSAVSRQIQALEAQLGVTLAHRARRQLQLTPAARTYAEAVRGALGQIARASLRLTVAPEGGSLNLAILPTFGMRWLVPRLPDFARRHPEITINMATRLKPVDFDAEGFDAALQFGGGDWPGCGALRLKTERVLPVCAPDLPGAAEAQGPRDIAALPLLHIETRPRAWAQWLGAHGVAAQPLPGMLYDQFSTITQAAVHGLGVALLPEYLIEQELATGRLIALARTPAAGLGDYYLVWPEARQAEPSLALFRDWLATQAEDEDALPR